MIYNIIPTTDCVFKALLGKKENNNLLINFINAFLEPENLIVSVEVINPYNEKEFIKDKLTIVDIKAKDSQGRTIQIDVQLEIQKSLIPRILYNWSDIYKSSLREADNFEKLKPVISIWLLTKNLFDEINDFHLPFSIYNKENSLRLTDHLSIHLLQLNKWTKETVENDKERWIYFFKKGAVLDDEHLPDFMKTKEMEQAMRVLKAFTEKEKDYHLYQNRINALRIENEWKDDIQKERDAKTKAEAKAEKERTEKEKA